jgi:hypothetical protein
MELNGRRDCYLSLLPMEILAHVVRHSLPHQVLCLQRAWLQSPITHHTHTPHTHTPHTHTHNRRLWAR